MPQGDKLIYTVEDEANIAELIRCTLESFSFRVKGFSCAEDLFIALQEEPADLILLDIMLPGMDGMEALSRLKASARLRNIPVILLTAKSSEPDKVAGLNGGADDYITKPFGILELTARVNAALRRTGGRRDEAEVLKFKEISMNPGKREVRLGQESIELTRKEYEILRLLLKNPDRVVSREEFLNTVWGYDFMGESRTLDIHIKTLRQKLGDDVQSPQYIRTIRGVGYCLAH